MNKKEYNLVSIIILNWDGIDDTIACVESLKKINYPNIEIIIVDNNSRGNDANILEKNYSSFIKVIKNNKNYGFAKGNNIAIQEMQNKLKGKYILFLNNDTIVSSNFLNEMVKVMEKNNQIAICGPKIYYYKYLGKKNIIWYGGGKINFSNYPGYNHINNLKEDIVYNKENEIETDFVSGACMLINVKKINALLDEGFYFGCEDIDKCLEAKKFGYKIFYVPKSVIWHKVSASRKKSFKSKIRDHITTLKLLKKHNKLFYLLIIKYIIQITTESFLYRIKRKL